MKITRPLFWLALISIAYAAMIVHIFPQVSYPVHTLKDGDKVTIAGKITDIDEKDNSIYLYIKSSRNLLLICEKTDAAKSLKTGNDITADCIFKEFSKPRNRGNYDEEQYYHSIGIYQKFKAHDICITGSSYSVLRESLRHLKSALETSVKRISGDDTKTAGIIIAMITGDRDGLENDMKDLYQSAGIFHIFAVSGLHISFAGMGAFRLLKKRFRFGPSAVISMICVICYCIMCGAGVSALRAVIMMAVKLICIRYGRTYDMVSSLSLACILILFSEPFYITGTAFRLSFAAISGLCFIAEPLKAFLNIPEKGFKSRLMSSFITGISITLTTLPIITMTYYSFPLYSVLLNMIVIPAMSVLLPGAFAGAAAGCLSINAGNICSGLVFIAVHIFTSISEAVLKLPFSVITTGMPDISKVICYYTILIAFSVFISNFRSIHIRKMLKLAITFAVFISLLIIICAKLPRSGMDVTFIDVDQGKCILILTPEGRVCMIDAGSTGTREVYRYRIKSALKYKGIDSIDYMIVTHPDTDHISGLIEILAETGRADHLAIKTILTPDCSGNDNYELLKELAREKNVYFTDLYAGMNIDLGNASMTCLHPQENAAEEDINDMSAVMRLDCYGFICLFTGDISGNIEQTIHTGCDLLDVAHHGSGYSSTDSFLKEAQPQIAVISSGADNIYGHPHKDTLERLSDAGAAIYITSVCGEIDVHISEDGSAAVNTLLHQNSSVYSGSPSS